MEHAPSYFAPRPPVLGRASDILAVLESAPELVEYRAQLKGKVKPTDSNSSQWTALRKGASERLQIIDEAESFGSRTTFLEWYRTSAADEDTVTYAGVNVLARHIGQRTRFLHAWNDLEKAKEYISEALPKDERDRQRRTHEADALRRRMLEVEAALALDNADEAATAEALSDENDADEVEKSETYVPRAAQLYEKIMGQRWVELVGLVEQRRKQAAKKKMNEASKKSMRGRTLAQVGRRMFSEEARVDGALTAGESESAGGEEDVEMADLVRSSPIGAKSPLRRRGGRGGLSKFFADKGRAAAVAAPSRS